MPVVDIVVAAAWVVFWIYWLIAATSAKSNRSRSPQGVGIRLLQGVGIRLLLGLLVLLTLRIPALRAYTGPFENPVTQGLGLIVVVVGLGEAVWARLYLRENWGMPMSQKVNPELVTTGPYRYVRHPIYSGLIVAMLGTTLAVSGFWLIVAAAMGIYFVYSAKVEERTMAKLFPDAYLKYERSSRMLIPFLF